MDAWLPLAALMTKLPAALDAQLRRDAGISHFEYFVLAMLSEAAEHTHRMSALAERTSSSLSRLSHVVKRLEQRGWVRRAPCPADGRYTNAILTDAGWEKVVATAPGHVDIVRRLVIDALTEEQIGQLRDIGRSIVDRVTPALTAMAASTGQVIDSESEPDPVL
ncbi:MarR family transcriptional regulator [Phytoactinopolyspora limicola]|uniref:MarR family transcriptional regulator n=1 Tax=Phytoactinopolyspora limicola TaxID=2715536 RepID=UPI001408F6C6